MSEPNETDEQIRRIRAFIAETEERLERARKLIKEMEKPTPSDSEDETPVERNL